MAVKRCFFCSKSLRADETEEVETTSIATGEREFVAACDGCYELLGEGYDYDDDDDYDEDYDGH